MVLGTGGTTYPTVLYPFVTNYIGAQAWYLLEGGVFSLQQCYVVCIVSKTRRSFNILTIGLIDPISIGT